MAAQKCLRENCKNKVDSAKRGEVFCPKHRGNAADAAGAAKAEKLSTVSQPQPVKEVIEHDDPEFGGVPQQPADEPAEAPLEGVVIDSPEAREAAEKEEAEARAELERLVEEVRMLHPMMEMFDKTKKRYDAIKAILREQLDPDTYNIHGVEFVIDSKDVFDAKLATAAAATEDEDGNSKKPVITKKELAEISVMTPNAAKANAHFKNRPEILKQLKKEQRSISIKSVAAEGSAAAAA